MRWTSRRMPPEETRQGPRAIVGAPQLQDLRQREPVPAPERLCPYPGPERALAERRPAAAEAVLAKARLPDLADLPEREESRDLSEHPIKERAAAAPPPADVQDPQPGLWDLLLRGRVRHLAHHLRPPRGWGTSSRINRSKRRSGSVISSDRRSVRGGRGSAREISAPSRKRSSVSARRTSPCPASCRANVTWWLSTTSPSSARRGTTTGR